MSGSSPTIEDCLVKGNTAASGAGIGFSDSTGTITNSTIQDNTADEVGGGLLCNGSSPEITNCIISGNTAVQYNGGGLYNYANGSPTLINCTFYDNSAGYGGGIYSGEYSYPSLINSILWNDLPNAIAEDDTSTIAASYSNIDGGWLGEGNIDADPLFVDPDGPDDDPDTFEDNDYRLSAGSPCIDAGDNTAVPEDIVTDLDGNPRFVDDPNTDDAGFGEPPIVDMGPYELQDPCTDDDGDGRVTICHVPPGNPGNAHTIIVNMRALPAHLAHGDYCGPCEGGLSADLEAGWILGAQGKLNTRQSVAPVLRERGP